MKSEKPNIFIIVGGPGSGKRTQAELLKKYLIEKNPGRCIGHHDNGDNLRRVVENSLFTNHMRQVIDKAIHTDGITVPGAITTYLWMRSLLEMNDGKSDMIFEGVFRTEKEVKQFIVVTDFCMKDSPRYFIHLNVLDEIMLKRIKDREDIDGVKRNDDLDEDTIKNRICTYNLESKPIYDEIIHNPDFISLIAKGEQPPEKVHEYIISYLNLN